jgi:deoxyhypusine monooxygenase
MRIVCEALLQRADSSLMRHELAYILGQIQNPKACETLSQILDDETDDVLVRHESAEALGAINQESSLPILTKYSTHASPEIAETCQIAIDLINWNHSAERETDLNKKQTHTVTGNKGSLLHSTVNKSKIIFNCCILTS